MLLSVLLFGFLNAAPAQVVSTGVGLVKGQVVTSRQVQIQNLLESALYDKSQKPQFKLLSLDSKAFNKATQEVLLESVIALEAHNFNVIQVTPEEQHQAEARVARYLKNNPVWKSLQVSSHELEAGLHQKIQAKKFIEFRATSSVLPVTDAEALRYYNENKMKFENLPFENLKENIKSYLSRTQVERRLKDWYDVLLSKYQVKNLIAEM
jgi:hypothetical protein